MADYLALKAELAKPAYAGKTDQEAADLLNTPGDGVVGVVPPNKLLIFAAKTGLRKGSRLASDLPMRPSPRSA